MWMHFLSFDVYKFHNISCMRARIHSNLINELFDAQLLYFPFVLIFILAQFNKIYYICWRHLVIFLVVLNLHKITNIRRCSSKVLMGFVYEWRLILMNGESKICDFLLFLLALLNMCISIQYLIFFNNFTYF
jgi:hypothetical protein